MGRRDRTTRRAPEPLGPMAPKRCRSPALTNGVLVQVACPNEFATRVHLPREPRIEIAALSLADGSRGLLAGCTDALVGAAAAEVAAHRGIDLLVTRIGFALQESDGAHDLAALAIAALRHVVRHPSL